MDFAQIIKELYLKRGWVAFGVAVALFAGLSTAYKISLFPPSLEKKALSIGTADTQILIDTPASSLTDLGVRLDPLAERASVYSRFMTSRPVRAAIAEEVGLDEHQIITEAPLRSNQPLNAQEPVAAERSKKLLEEDEAYRLRFQTDDGLPTITIFAQAPRAEDAIRLANAGAAGFARYVKAIQAKQEIPRTRRVQVRQLGRAEGGMVAEKVNMSLAAVTFIGAFIVWCLLILLVTTLARNVRQLQDSEQAAEDQSPATESH
jgi:hypothetical protein